MGCGTSRHDKDKKVKKKPSSKKVWKKSEHGGTGSSTLTDVSKPKSSTRSISRSTGGTRSQSKSSSKDLLHLHKVPQKPSMEKNDLQNNSCNSGTSSVPPPRPPRQRPVSVSIASKDETHYVDIELLAPELSQTQGTPVYCGLETSAASTVSQLYDLQGRAIVPCQQAQGLNEGLNGNGAQTRRPSRKKKSLTLSDVQKFMATADQRPCSESSTSSDRRLVDSTSPPNEQQTRPSTTSAVSRTSSPTPYISPEQRAAARKLWKKAANQGRLQDGSPRESDKPRSVSVFFKQDNLQSGEDGQESRQVGEDSFTSRKDSARNCISVEVDTGPPHKNSLSRWKDSFSLRKDSLFHSKDSAQSRQDNAQPRKDIVSIGKDLLSHKMSPVKNSSSSPADSLPASLENSPRKGVVSSKQDKVSPRQDSASPRLDTTSAKQTLSSSNLCLALTPERVPSREIAIQTDESTSPRKVDNLTSRQERQLSPPKRLKKKKKHCQLSGPLERRTCTDRTFLYIGLGLIGLLILQMIIVFARGDDDQLWWLRDSWGNICGKANRKVDGQPYSGVNASDKKLLFYPSTSLFIKARAPTPDDASFCVNKCPVQPVIDGTDLLTFIRGGNPLCGYSELPVIEKVVQDAWASGKLTATGHEDSQQDPSADNANLDRRELVANISHTLFCPKLPLPVHTEYRGHCVPSVVVEKDTHWLDVLLTTSMFRESLKDLQNAWREILIMTGTAFAACYLLLLILTFFHVYTVVFVCVLMFLSALATFALLWIIVNQVYKSSRDSSDARHMVYEKPIFKKIVGTGTVDELQQRLVQWAVLGAILSLIMMILLRSMWKLARNFRQVGMLIGIGTRVLKRHAPLFLLPITAVTIFASFSILQIEFCHLLFSLESPVYNSSTHKALYDLPPILQAYGYLNLALMSWFLVFILECHNFVAVYTTVVWYFEKHVKNTVCMRGVMIMMRYHIGSVALASIILPLLALPKKILFQMQTLFHVQKPADATGFGSAVAHCWLRCLCFLRFLSRKAYTEIVLYGQGFCASAKRMGRTADVEARGRLRYAKSTRSKESLDTHTDQMHADYDGDRDSNNSAKEKDNGKLKSSRYQFPEKEAAGEGSPSAVVTHPGKPEKSNKPGVPKHCSVQVKLVDGQLREVKEGKIVDYNTEWLSLFFGLIKVFIVPPVLILGFSLLKDKKDVTFILGPLAVGAASTFVTAHCCFILMDVVVKAACLCRYKDVLNNAEPVRPEAPMKHMASQTRSLPSIVLTIFNEEQPSQKVVSDPSFSKKKKHYL